MQYTDGNGTVKPLARGDIKVTVEGGKLLGLGNGCPYNEKGYLNDVTDTYFGEALAIVKATGKKVILTAESKYGSGKTEVAVTE